MTASWIRVGAESCDECPYKRQKRRRHAETERGRHVKADTRWHSPKLRGAEGRQQGEGVRQLLPQKEPPLLQSYDGKNLASRTVRG